MVSLFKESASKLCTLGRLVGSEYVPEVMEQDTIISQLLPKAMDIFQSELPQAQFCDKFGTPLDSLARRVADLMLIDHKCRDPAAVVAAILADLPNKKEIESKIEDKLGVIYVKVWKEVKLFLDPNNCEVCSRDTKDTIVSNDDQISEHKTDSVCEDGNCILAWLEGKHFSLSAKLSMAAWTVLLARLVTGSHWPMGWTAPDVRVYLDMLDRLMGIILDGDVIKVGKKSVLREIAEEFFNISKNYA